MSQKLYPTPHINAKPCDFAKTVLMPGDPKRSQFIAENFLTDAKLINDVRAVKGYTGFYKGKKVSVMASGMGMPSIGIYSYELYNIFGVENIIRVGSAGAYSEKVKVRDIIIAQGACTDSNFLHQYNLPGLFSPIANYNLLKTCAQIADSKNLNYYVGNILSTDAFYGDLSGMPEHKLPVKAWAKMGVLGVEMEAAALYAVAARSGKNALAVCTVSDHLVTGESLSSELRQKSFTEMIELALETAVSLEK